MSKLARSFQVMLFFVLTCNIWSEEAKTADEKVKKDLFRQSLERSFQQENIKLSSADVLQEEMPEHEGLIAFQRVLKGGVPHGHWFERHKKGTLKFEGFYKDGHPIGVWSGWSETGEKRVEFIWNWIQGDINLMRKYEKGVVISEITNVQEIQIELSLWGKLIRKDWVLK